MKIKHLVTIIIVHMFWIRGTILAHDTVTEPNIIDPIYHVIYFGFFLQIFLQVIVKLSTYVAHQIHPECLPMVYECARYFYVGLSLKMAPWTHGLVAIT